MVEKSQILYLKRNNKFQNLVERSDVTALESDEGQSMHPEFNTPDNISKVDEMPLIVESAYEEKKQNITETSKSTFASGLSSVLVKDFSNKRIRNLKEETLLKEFECTNGECYYIINSEGEWPMYYARYLGVLDLKTRTEIESFKMSRKSIIEERVVTDHARTYILRHPCILPLIGWAKLARPQGEGKGLFYIYTHLSDSLDTYLAERNPINRDEAIQLIINLIYGYLYLRSKQITYRPDHIFMDGNQPVFGFLHLPTEGIEFEEQSARDVDELNIIIAKIHSQSDPKFNCEGFIRQDTGPQEWLNQLLSQLKIQL